MNITAGTLKIEVDQNVSTITFQHPSHNSMPLSQLHQLRDAILKEGSNRASKIIVLQSAGDRTFCAGANFQELASITTIEKATEFFMGFAQVILAIRDCQKLVVGRVQGKAVGGGVGLLAATDYCLATRRAEMRLSELSIGIGPYVIEPAITRKVGKAGFTSLALNPGSWKTSQWGVEHGLYQMCFDDIEAMDQFLTEYLQTMVTYSSEALTKMKALLWEGSENWSFLLEERANNSAQLLLTGHAQNLIRKLVSTD
ncbi:MAG: enoyl-CoA hydratase/isomerase family protein [Saprospiraceae bacterium]|nr:enoyl-CoA hydratase/isomerase family protein [Saprospiraceae bacterium]